MKLQKVFVIASLIVFMSIGTVRAEEQPDKLIEPNVEVLEEESVTSSEIAPTVDPMSIEEQSKNETTTSSESSLALYIVIALIIATIIWYIMFRKNNNQQITNNINENNEGGL